MGSSGIHDLTRRIPNQSAQETHSLLEDFLGPIVILPTAYLSDCEYFPKDRMVSASSNVRLSQSQMLSS